jgi:hypothetical protein
MIALTLALAALILAPLALDRYNFARAKARANRRKD